MQPRAKIGARDRENGRPGRSPGRLALETRARLRVRKEGWDEHLMVGLAVALGLIVIVMTIYQAVAWTGL